ncbi:uncharacterized protein LOC131012474 isoform X2 [Salvia miltiorrhiza]|nr:uncharacterized protein LOC131012474 isoform X2 [Salvia miltiorrhiza]
MRPKCIILTHGGQWNDITYVGGQREFVRVPPDGMKYVELLRKVGCAVQADTNVHAYVIDAIVPSPLDELLRMKITDDDDLVYVMELFDVPTLYVTLSPRINTSKEHSSMNLLNAQMHQVQHTYVHQMSNIPHSRPPVGNDAAINPPNVNIMNEREDVRDLESADGVQTDCIREQGVGDEDRRDDDVEANNKHVDRGYERDIHNVPPIGSSSCNEEEHRQGPRQWVIPGAKYHASLLIEPEISYDYNSDTISIGAIFTDKENMRIQLGLYHLLNRVEYIVDRSTKRRFGALCKFKDQCSFLLRATAYGAIWRIFKLVAHTCQKDLRLRCRPTICAKVVGAYFAPTLSKEGSILKPKEIQAQLKRDFGVDVDYHTALAGRNQAITMIHGDKGDKDKSFRSSFQSSSSHPRHAQVCSTCHKSGHNRARCTEDVPLTQDEDVSSNHLTMPRKRRPKRCGICGEVGHTRGKCTQRVV